KVKNVDYEKVGTKVKSGSKTFFDTIGDIIMFFFKIIGKFIGILLILIGASTLIGLFVGFFTVGILDFVNVPGIDFYEMINNTGAPVWLVSLLVFFVVGIPFFFLLYLGLKILVNNLKSIGNIAKFSLLGLWLLSIGGLFAMGVRQAAEFANVGSVNIKESIIPENSSDTLVVKMRDSELLYDWGEMSFGGMTLGVNENDDRVLVSDDVYFRIRQADDDVIKMNIRKDAHGSSTSEARERAKNIEYSYALDSTQIVLDDHLTTGVSYKAREQRVFTTIYVPTGQVLKLDRSTSGHIGRGIANDRDLYRSSMVGHTWMMGEDGELKCLDCPALDEMDADEAEGGKIIINEDGVDIDIQDNDEGFQMKIDEDGVKIQAGNKNDN
ncbi:MAG: hypothetical protein AAFU57_14855, partial [Bacteroidota bacterium]